MTATVMRNVGSGSYQVVDESGRQYRVTSADVYRRGDRVEIIEGIIVGKAVAAPEPTVYYV